MDLKWQMAMLTMSARRFLQKTGRNLGVKGTETIGFDKTKCDGLGYDWSDHAKDGPTNFVVMAYTTSSLDSEVLSYSKACLKSYKTLKEHYDNLTKDFSKSQSNLGTYKVGLESTEARLKVYKKNDAVFEDDIKILKLDVIESVTSLPGIEKSKVKTSETKLKNVSAPIIEDWVSDSEDENEIKTETKQIKPSFAKVKFVKLTEHVKSLRKSVKKTSSRAVVSVNTAKPINTAYHRSTVNGARPASNIFNKAHSHGNPQQELQEKGVIDSGCSRHMTGNMSYLFEYKKIDGGYVAFGGDPKGGKITGKGRKPALSFMRPFRCPVTILNTLDHLGRERAQRNEFESIFGQDKNANDNRMFIPISATRFTYVYLGGSIPVDAATLLNDDLPNDPLMPDLKDTADTGIFDDLYDDREVGEKADTNNLEVLTVKLLCDEFEQMINKRFQMSSMGELTFFLGLQVKQKDDGNFINQDKYVADILKKFGFSLVKTAITPIETNKALLKNEEARDVDVYLYRSMIGSLMKSTTRGCQFLGKRLISWQCKKQTVVTNSTTKAEYVAAANGKKIIVTKASIRRDLQLQDAEGTACLPNDAIFEELARMRFVQVFVNHQLGDMPHHKKIFVTLSLTKKVFANIKREGICFSGIITPLFETLMVQALEEVAEEETKSRRIQRKETVVPHSELRTDESVPTPSNDPLPSGEDRMQLSELMKLYAKLSDMVLSLEQIKTNQAAKIKKLKKRVKKLKGKKKNKNHGLKRMYKVGLSVRIVFSDEEGLEMFSVDDLDGDEVIIDVTTGENVEQSTKVVEKEVSTAVPVTTAGKVVTTAEDVKVTTAATTLQISKDELTLDQTLIEIKEAKPKAKGFIVQEPSEFRTTSSSQPSQLLQAKDKAQKLQTEEQEKLTDAEKARLFMELLENRRKFFARKREIEKRNRPPTKAQKRNLMCTYLKNMDGWKPKSLKKKSFDEIQKLFDSVIKKVNTFVDMNTEIVEERSKKTQAEVTEGSSKRAGDKLEQENAKR
nr:ribonuclease H-like domain, reverse transcriptase, RNA-dependent DNA polymerase [Tanacetum cinerariifolium]